MFICSISMIYPFSIFAARYSPLRWLNIYGFILLSTIVFPAITFCQMGDASNLIKKIDRLKQYSNYLSDTTYINSINQLAFLYADSYPDSALNLLKENVEISTKTGYTQGAIESYKIIGNAWQTKGNFEKALDYYGVAYGLAQKHNLSKAIPALLNNIGLARINQGNYPEALRILYQTLTSAKAVNDKFVLGNALSNIGTVDFYQGKMAEADSAYKQALQMALEMNDSVRIIYAYNNIGEVNMELDKSAEALHNFQKAYKIALLKNNPEMQVVVTNNLANTYFKKEDFKQAILEYEMALIMARKNDYGMATCNSLLGLAKVYNKQGLLKPALANGLEALQKAQQMGQTQLMRDANKMVADIYENSGDGMEALKHFKMYMVFTDSLNNLANERRVANEKANYQISQKEQIFERASLQQRWLSFSAFAALFSLGIILFIIAHNKRRLKKKNIDLENKNVIIKAQKLKVEETLSTLKSTQAQLIQSEKMASMGVLTAGIAHEIQNPLNFVNNFSELSDELIDEMKEELTRGNYDLANKIANDVKGNMVKINHHGKRADAIVKGMLQHSKSGSGKVEPTNINALCEEFLKLSYNGFLARKNSPVANMPVIRQTDFDKSIDKLNVIPQNIGSVLLNVFNNAFYAVNEKMEMSDGSYKPSVSVQTKKLDGKVEIIISDNGCGIPAQIIDKIFQPFFTTKISGEGTGLGLSLSYDIIKAHSGEIRVNSKVGEGAEFIISLPIV